MTLPRFLIRKLLRALFKNRVKIIPYMKIESKLNLKLKKIE